MNAVKRFGAATLLSLPLFAQATELDKAAAIETQTVKAAAVSQQRIDVSDEQAQFTKAEIERLQREIENLTLYRNHLKSLVENQEQEQASLNQQLTDIAQTRQGIVPLMYRMIDDLDVWVSQDLPIKPEQRQSRVDGLKTLMTRADVADAEKFRRILEAYQIELDYGAKLGTYQETLSLDGVDREVDVLHLGRLSLVARSLNGDAFWFYEQSTAKWLPVDKRAYEAIQQAFDVAKKKQPPTLMALPLSISMSKGAEQ
ncbi:DUF3450 domain-containing protein [Grimontia sp. NTOU-MAR1]|uniref:DUF3450 domain-containing protein n=1 Tax=Grimontia sp. NTOU-MAR1 TaxID=3111011 RepID=UPI002DBFE3CF|nr:DUF3450 domain-containing protein [Grimontia sp. NTOU-MAR1]WRW00931.1 DUF3450 domain-containing protein [Grimontia sp. NTOU-MAR1]